MWSKQFLVSASFCVIFFCADHIADGKSCITAPADLPDIGEQQWFDGEWQEYYRSKEDSDGSVACTRYDVAFSRYPNEKLQAIRVWRDMSDGSDHYKKMETPLIDRARGFDIWGSNFTVFETHMPGDAIILGCDSDRLSVWVLTRQFYDSNYDPVPLPSEYVYWISLFLKKYNITDDDVELVDQGCSEDFLYEALESGTDESD